MIDSLSSSWMREVMAEKPLKATAAAVPQTQSANAAAMRAALNTTSETGLAGRGGENM